MRHSSRRGLLHLPYHAWILLRGLICANTPILLPLLYVGAANAIIYYLAPESFIGLTLPASLIGLLFGLYQARDHFIC